MPTPSSYHISTPIDRRAAAVALVVLVLAVAPAARAESLAALLAGVATPARFATPARADATITRPADATGGARRAIVIGRGQTLYVELESGFRALLHPGKTIVGEGGRVRRAPVGAALPGTDLLLEDLRVFSPATLALPQVSDDSPAGVVVTSAPAGASAYALLVYTIDRERHAVIKTQYYRGRLDNLVKIRRDVLVDVGGRWRPGTIDVQDLSADTATRLVLAWRPAPAVAPALFSPASLRRPSGLEWPG